MEESCGVFSSTWGYKGAGGRNGAITAINPFPFHSLSKRRLDLSRGASVSIGLKCWQS